MEFSSPLSSVVLLSLFPIFLSGFGFVVSGVFPISLISSTGSYEHEHGIAILKAQGKPSPDRRGQIGSLRSQVAQIPKSAGDRRKPKSQIGG